MALNDRYINKFAPLDSTTIYPKPDHELLYTPMTGEMKYPIGYNFASRIPFHLLRCWCNTCTNHITNDMIHFISSCDLVGSLILNSLAFHCCLRPSAPSHHSTCPSHLQLVHQAKTCLDLLHLNHMTQCHVSYAMSSFITYVSLATNPSHLHYHGMSFSHTCTCGLITYVLHLNTY